MRLLLTIAAALLFVTTMALAQDAQRTPPGGDMVGSDRPVTQNGVRSEPTASPDANQRMTQTEGTSSGYDNSPAFAGSSTHGTARAQQSPGKTGMDGQTAATAGRHRSYSNSKSATGYVRRPAAQNGNASGKTQKRRHRSAAKHRRSTNQATQPPR